MLNYPVSSSYTQPVAASLSPTHPFIPSWDPQVGTQWWLGVGAEGKEGSPEGFYIILNGFVCYPVRKDLRLELTALPALSSNQLSELGISSMPNHGSFARSSGVSLSCGAAGSDRKTAR